MAAGGDRASAGAKRQVVFGVPSRVTYSLSWKRSRSARTASGANRRKRRRTDCRSVYSKNKVSLAIATTHLEGSHREPHDGPEVRLPPRAHGETASCRARRARQENNLNGTARGMSSRGDIAVYVKTVFRTSNTMTRARLLGYIQHRVVGSAGVTRVP